MGLPSHNVVGMSLNFLSKRQPMDASTIAVGPRGWTSCRSVSMGLRIELLLNTVVCSASMSYRAGKESSSAGFARRRIFWLLVGGSLVNREMPFLTI